MASGELKDRRADGYYRPDPYNLPERDMLEIPSISDVLDECELFQESHADDGVGSEDAYRHSDPHWVLYSLLAAVKCIQELEQVALLAAWEDGYAHGLAVCKNGNKH